MTNTRKIHEKTLWLVHLNHTFSFSNLFEIVQSDKIHQRNMQVRNTEIFNVQKNLAPEINYFKGTNIRITRNVVKSMTY